MKNNERKDLRRKETLLLRLFLVLALFLFSYYSFTEAYTIGPNYRNISVDTTANITNAQPEILNITLEDPITLNAGFTTLVTCNVSIRDWNGGNTISNVNASLFHSTSSVFAADDNNTHYTNGSCTSTGLNGYYRNYSCGFNVYYYALPNTWNCSVFVNDTAAFEDNATDNSSVNTLLALNVTNPIDYGDLAINDISANKTANITNFGNVAINVSVYGYGNTTNDGLAMVCAQGNITIDNERYAANTTADWLTKTPLTGSGTQIPGLTVSKQTVPAVPVTNVTYWQLFVPPNPFGVCNGTVVFQAESST